jgi:hypothetical protein
MSRISRDVALVGFLACLGAVLGLLLEIPLTPEQFQEAAVTALPVFDHCGAIN